MFLKPLKHFGFQMTEERFHHTVVIAVTLSGHGLNYTMFAKGFTVSRVLVLPPLI